MKYRQVIAVRSIPFNSVNDHDIVAYRYKTFTSNAIGSTSDTSLAYWDSNKAEMCNWALQSGNQVVVLYRTGYVNAHVYKSGNGNNLFLKTEPDGIRENNLSFLDKF